MEYNMAIFALWAVVTIYAAYLLGRVYSNPIGFDEDYRRNKFFQIRCWVTGIAAFGLCTEFYYLGYTSFFGDSLGLRLDEFGDIGLRSEYIGGISAFAIFFAFAYFSSRHLSTVKNYENRIRRLNDEIDSLKAQKSELMKANDKLWREAN